MFKNVANQKLIVFAFDASTGLPKTGDAANIVAYVSKDYGAVTVLTDTGTGGASEMDATNAKGYYIFDLTQGETNADFLLFSGKSSTTNIVVVGAPAAVFTLPPNFTKAVIDTAGLIDSNVVKVGPTGAGTAQTARDIGTSVLLSSGTGTGQLSLSAGLVTLAGVTHTGAVIPTVTTVTNQLTAAAIATGIWTDTTAGDFTTALSIGKSVMNGVTLGTGLTVASVSGAVGSVAGNVGGNVTGSVGSISGITFPTNFSVLSISATTGLVDITQTAADKVWGTATRVLTAGTNIVLAKGTGVTGFNDIAATAIVSSGAITTSGGAVSTVTTVTNQLTAAAIATGVWQDSTAGDFTTANSIGKSLYNSFTAGTSVFTVAALANAPVTAAGPSAATIATAVWTDTTASDFTTALSIGKSVMNGVTLGTGLTVARVTLTDTLTTYTGNTVQTGDSFARIGATGSGLTSLASSSTALSTAQWTNTLATNLGTTNTTVSTNLDTTVSSRGTSTLTQTQVTGGAYSVQSASCVLGDARIANLDGTITSRMATYAQPTGFLAANFTTGIPISGDLSATMKTSVTTAATAATPVVTISGTISTLDALNTSLNSTHGAGSWATATGFSTFNPASDIVAHVTLVDTTTTNTDMRGTNNAALAATALTNVTWTDAKAAFVDAAISTRLATSGYTAPDNASITAIKAKTDNLPSDPADESLIIAATDAIMGRLGAPAGASVSADIADLPTNAELATALGTSDDSTLAAVEVLRKLLRADHYIDTGTAPWALVYMQEGTGGIGVGVELFRKRLASVTGTNLVSTDTVVGQAKT